MLQGVHINQTLSTIKFVWQIVPVHIVVVYPLPRYIAQHMNIHNPEDFALFRITERKGANPTLILLFSPNSPISRLHLSWGHIPAQNTGKVTVIYIISLKEKNKFWSICYRKEGRVSRWSTEGLTATSFCHYHPLYLCDSFLKRYICS